MAAYYMPRPVVPSGSSYTQTYSTATRTQAASALNEALSLTLVTDVVAALNTTNAAVNELKKLQNGIINDLRTARVIA